MLVFALHPLLTGDVINVHSQLDAQSPHTKLQLFSQSDNVRCGPKEFCGVTFDG